jgi:hypothetical protein
VAIDHWSEIRLDNASIVYKSEAGSHRPPPDSGAPLLYRFVLQTVVFRVILPWLRFRPGQFCNHKDRSIQEEFWEKKNWVLWLYNAAKRDLQLWRSGEPQTLFINTSSFCYFHQLKIYKNYCYWTNILSKFEETKQLHCERKRTEVSFKIPWGYFHNYMN